jgi:predicted nucleotidyltransferase
VIRERQDEAVEMIRRNGGGNRRVRGSIACGADGPDSDIGILAAVAPERARDFANLPHELSDLLGLPVEVVSGCDLSQEPAGLASEARPLRTRLSVRRL